MLQLNRGWRVGVGHENISGMDNLSPNHLRLAARTLIIGLAVGLSRAYMCDQNTRPPVAQRSQVDMTIIDRCEYLLGLLIYRHYLENFVLVQ